MRAKSDKSRRKEKEHPSASALKIALIYALFGAIWIIASDRILATLVPDVQRLTTLMTYKGWFYVAFTAALVYLLVWRQVQRLLKLQRRLQGKEEAFRRYIEDLPVGVFRVSLKDGGRFLLTNHAAARLFGFSSPEALMERRDADLFMNEADRGQVYGKLQEEGQITGEVVQLKKHGGQPIWAALTASLAHDEESGELYVDGVLVDETERRRTEQELRLLWRALNQADEGIIITDMHHAILYVNPAFERLSGHAREEVLGQDMGLLRSGKHDTVFYEQIGRTVEQGGVWRGRITNLRKDGTPYEEEVSVSPVYDADGVLTHNVFIARDVSHEALLERQLMQAQKMEAIGRMAGGIAHDFNNILAAIIGYADLAHMDLPEGNRVRGYLGEILTASKRARDIVRRILTFTRQGQYRPTPVLPAPIVEEAMALVRSTMPSSIRLHTDIAPVASHVLMDAVQLHQVVMNLATNAWQAMGMQGGDLRVGLAELRIEETMTSPAPGNYVLLTVSDTGQGMDEETLRNIFDPYFTTKGVGEGTGLGLATVHAIVENCGGKILVDSTPGKGAEFRVYLPVTMEAMVVAEPDTRTEQGRGEWVLLVDDEAQVLDPTRQYLERRGYRVRTFSEAEQAWACFRAGPQAFAAIITDHTMPDMTGMELARLCHELRADLPIVMVTGHGNTVLQQAAQEAGICRVLTKPVLGRDLCRVLRELLDASSGEELPDTPRSQD